MQGDGSAGIHRRECINAFMGSAYLRTSPSLVETGIIQLCFMYATLVGLKMKEIIMKDE
jgi:hypothetical protein